MDALDSDPTGASLMAALSEELGKLPYKARKEAQRMLKDLLAIPESVCDYRVRLEDMGIDSHGLRPLGGRPRAAIACSAESLPERHPRIKQHNVQLVPKMVPRQCRRMAKLAD